MVSVDPHCRRRYLRIFYLMSHIASAAAFALSSVIPASLHELCGIYLNDIFFVNSLKRILSVLSLSVHLLFSSEGEGPTSAAGVACMST